MSVIFVSEWTLKGKPVLSSSEMNLKDLTLESMKGYSQLPLNGHLYKVDTSIKWTPL